MSGKKLHLVFSRKLNFLENSMCWQGFSKNFFRKIKGIDKKWWFMIEVKEALEEKEFVMAFSKRGNSPKTKRIPSNSKYARALDDPNDPILGVYKQSVIAGELKRFKGAVSSAAKSLGVSKTTLQKYIIKSKVLKDLIVELTETEIDEVESELMGQVRKGNMTAILFYLKCKGKDRGWVERSELSVDVKPITFKYTLAKGGQHAAKRAAKTKEK
jgi:hypothetical protein